MTRNELLKQWCAAEGGKKSALDWPQSKQCYAKLRQIIGEETGVDLDDVITWKCACIDFGGLSGASGHFEAFRTYAWRNGKPVK